MGTRYNESTMRGMFDRFFDSWASNNSRESNVYDEDGKHWWTMWNPEEAIDMTYDFDEDDQTIDVHYFITDSKAEKWSEGYTGPIKLTGEYDDDDMDTALSDDDSPIMDIERDFHDIEQRINMSWPNPMED